MSGSNCCFLICIQTSQEAGQVVWYSHLFQNFPQFLVIHTDKGFGAVNEEEVDVFLDFSCFFYDPMDVGNLTCGFSFFSKSSLYIWKVSVHILRGEFPPKYIPQNGVPSYMSMCKVSHPDIISCLSEWLLLKRQEGLPWWSGG